MSTPFRPISKIYRKLPEISAICPCVTATQACIFTFAWNGALYGVGMEPDEWLQTLQVALPGYMLLARMSILELKKQKKSCAQIDKWEGQQIETCIIQMCIIYIYK